MGSSLPQPIRHRIRELLPIKKVLLSFLFLILTGTFLLLLPASTIKGISFIDALFTSTSAVCVTGLVVLDTAKDFTFFGQIVILLLIQFGGLGIMTFTIAIVTMMGGDFSIKWRFTLESFYSDLRKLPIKSVVKRILLYTIFIELIVAVILFTQFIQEFNFGTAVWHSLFHSISAFCNAGFSTFSENIVRYQDNTVIILSLSTNIVLGGIGFLVLTELARARYRNIPQFFRQFTLHTKIVLVVTMILIFGGALLIIILEWHHLLENMPFKTKILSGLFQSISCRTAGFNSIDIGGLRDSTLFVMIVLMFIGGSPGSIAGGIKTTTIAVVAGHLYSKFRNRHQVIFWSKALDPDTIDKGNTLAFLSILVISSSTFLLLAINSFDLQCSFMAGLYEVTSALNTVGLSTGITPKLPTFGKLLLSLVMYIGRLGPLTLITALTASKKDVAISFAEENIMIG